MKVLYRFNNPNYSTREDPHMIQGFDRAFRHHYHDYTAEIMVSERSRTLYQDSDILLSYKSQVPSYLLADEEILSVYIYPDTRYKLDSTIVQEAQKYDVFLLNDWGSRYMWEEELGHSNIHYFPQAVNPDLYSGVNYRADENQRIWTFAGTQYPQRIDFYFALLDVAEKGSAFGNNWNLSGFPYARGFPVYNKGFAIAHAKGLVGLNRSFRRDNEYCWSTRVYKIMASGVPLLTDKVNRMDEVFTPGEHCLYYNDLDEMVDMLDNPMDYFSQQELEDIAEQGQNEIREKHTYNHRGTLLCEILEEYI